MRPIYKIKPRDSKALIALYQEMEFKNWLSELLSTTKTEVVEKTTSYCVIDTDELFEQWSQRLQKEKEFVFLIEAANDDYMSGKVVGIAFVLEQGDAGYLPITSTAKIVLQRIKPLLEDPATRKISYDVKYSTEVLANHGITLRGVIADVMLESYILDSTSNHHDMHSLTLKYLGREITTYEDIAGKGNKQIAFAAIDTDHVVRYAVENAKAIGELHRLLWSRIQRESGLQYIFEHIEMPLISVLADMERTGVLIDPDLLKKQEIELQTRLLELEKETFDLAGEEFNLIAEAITRNFISKIKIARVVKNTDGSSIDRGWCVTRIGLVF